jgi:hypothetical protein
MTPRLLALIALVCGCRNHATCRPDTIFLHLSLDAAAAGADTLDVSLISGSGTLQATTPYHGGTTVEVDFPSGKYPSGESVTLVVAVRRQGIEIARGTVANQVLPKGCAAFTISVGAGGDMGPTDGGGSADLAGLDFAGADFSADLAAANSLPNGTPCTSGDQCISTFCVDGYCCALACTGQCQACDIGMFAGECMPVTSGPPHGTRAQCAGLDAGVCGGQCGSGSTIACTYPGPATTCAMQTCSGSTKYLASGCNQAGACSAQSTVNCSQGCNGMNCLGACGSDAECAAATPSMPYCDLNSGNCLATKPLGYACSTVGECTSNHCADGVCCDSDCNLQCQYCKGIMGVTMAGTCGVVNGGVISTAQTPRTACASDGSSCGGSCDGKATDTSCIYPVPGTLCGACCHGGRLDTCDGTGSCTTHNCPTGACVSAAGPGSCSSTYSACNSNYSCSSSSQCLTNSCLGGGCCTSGCPAYPNEYCDANTGACGCNPMCSPSGDCGPDGCGGGCDTCSNGIDAICCSGSCTPCAGPCHC